MSISPTVDAGYRLQPADLDGAPRRAVIANVSFQGLEEMTPVLHFEGQTKRLVLSPEQTAQAVELMGTSLFHNWIGRPLVLVPVRRRKGPTEIVLAAPTARPRAAAIPTVPQGERKEWRMAITVVAAITLVSTGYYFLVNLGWLAYGVWWFEELAKTFG